MVQTRLLVLRQSHQLLVWVCEVEHILHRVLLLVVIFVAGHLKRVRHLKGIFVVCVNIA